MVRRIEDWQPMDWVYDRIENIMDRLLDKIKSKR
jgi:hypothetical protein